MFGESRQDDVLDALASADSVFFSEIMFVEIDRALHRRVHLGEMTSAAATSQRRELADIAENWLGIALTPGVLDGARRPMPVEPLRTIDALHVSSALETRIGEQDLRVLTLDACVRANAEALGFRVEPETSEP